MATFESKVLIGLTPALLFGLVKLPEINKLIPGASDTNSCPTNPGLIISTLIFFVLIYLSMWSAPHSPGLKLKFSIYGTLIFYLLSSPAMFSFTSSLLGDWISDSAGCPSKYGILLHSIVYLAILVGVMYLPADPE